MPIVDITLYKGKTALEKKAILDAVHEALIAAFKIPEDDRNQRLHEYSEEDFERRRTRSANCLIIEITAFKGRSREAKKRLFAAITENLQTKAWIAPNDVIIVINEQPLENWGIGGLPADEVNLGFNVKV
jgi:phenylpyruvate tautomerase PptA (4-oxalocrotonate tautomerase family)